MPPPAEPSGRTDPLPAQTVSRAPLPDLHPLTPDVPAEPVAKHPAAPPSTRPVIPVETPSSPVRDEPVSERPNPAPETAAAAAAQARSVLASWIGALASGDAARIGRTLDGGPKPQSDLLTLVRDGRVTGATTDAVDVQVDGDHADGTASSNLTWRSPFGATRHAAVRFTFQLEHANDGWRVSAAHIVGSPNLR